MKKVLLFCILYSVAVLAQAQTCPPAPKGYIFRVGAWGDHVSERSDVRCYYYSSTDQQIKLNAGVWLDESAFVNHPQWKRPSTDRYFICSPSTDVRDCPFD